MKLNFKTIDTAIIFCLMATVFYATTAFAGTDGADADKNAISDVLCKVVNLLTGAVGKAIATISIVVIGITLFLGKMSWPVAASTAVGIGLIFGSAQLAEYIGATGAGSACSTT